MVMSMTQGSIHFAFVRVKVFKKEDRLVWLIFFRKVGVTCVYACLSVCSYVPTFVCY